MTEKPKRKPLVRLGGSEIKTPPFTKNARVEAGQLLRRLQEGELLSMPLSRPMPSIGSGCHELRVRDAGHYWRLVYRIDSGAILLIAVFPKGTQKTPQKEIDLCKGRLKQFDSDVKEATNPKKGSR